MAKVTAAILLQYDHQAWMKSPSIFMYHKTKWTKVYLEGLGILSATFTRAWAGTCLSGSTAKAPSRRSWASSCTSFAPKLMFWEYGTPFRYNLPCLSSSSKPFWEKMSRWSLNSRNAIRMSTIIKSSCYSKVQPGSIVTAQSQDCSFIMTVTQVHCFAFHRASMPCEIWWLADKFTCTRDLLIC